MERSVALLVLVTLLAPLAAAEGAPVDASAAPPLEGPTPAQRFAAAASAAGATIAKGASAAGSAAASLGHGIADAASAVGAGIASLAKGALALLASLGSALASAGAALVAFVASSASAIGAWLGLAGRGSYEFVRAHPVETAAAAGGTLGLGMILYALRKFGFLLGIPLYTRLAPSEMLDNHVRASVYEHVRAHPGAHPSAIAQELSLGWGTVVYHLSKLEASSLVTSRNAHHRKCFFAIGSELNSEARTAVAAMAHDKARLIVETVRGAPGITQKDLASQIGMSQALASWHVKRLVQSGVLSTARSGRSNTLTVNGHVPTLAPAAVAA